MPISTAHISFGYYTTSNYLLRMENDLFFIKSVIFGISGHFWPGFLHQQVVSGPFYYSLEVQRLNIYRMSATARIKTAV